MSRLFLKTSWQPYGGIWKTGGLLTERLFSLTRQLPRVSVLRIGTQILSILESTPLFCSMRMRQRVERRLASLLISFCRLTVFVACLGILGLAAYSTEQRTNPADSLRYE